MINPVVFYSRCKPQQVDILEIALREKRIFIGHPFLKPDMNYDPSNLKKCIVDLKCPENEWVRYLKLNPNSNKQKNYSQNRNFAGKIGKGSIALIPRPSRGVIYLGKVKSDFELINSPPWYDEYLKLRTKSANNQNEVIDNVEFLHAADIGQCWEVDEFTPVPFTKFPRWILRSLFGRSTYGIIPDNSEKTYKAIEDILSEKSFRQREWTNDLNEIERRLREDLSPSAFEHLMVSIFQLENPNEIWWHTGGSGDGGLDGVGANLSGELTSLLQCKLRLDGKTPIFDVDFDDLEFIKNKRRIVASIFHDTDFSFEKGEIEFFGVSKISKLCLQHSANLPQAISMRIKNSG